MSTTSAAAGLLARQLKQMQNDKDIPGISCGLVDNNVFEWEVMLMINDECKYYGGESIVLSSTLDCLPYSLHNNADKTRTTPTCHTPPHLLLSIQT